MSYRRRFHPYSSVARRLPPLSLDAAALPPALGTPMRRAYDQLLQLNRQEGRLVSWDGSGWQEVVRSVF